MAKSTKHERERISATLDQKETKRLNDYCVKIVNRNGKIQSDLKQKIVRKAVHEWLDKHENDTTIQF